jgi:Asp-tRNA(Asn)/Glu-tRNA(Gln) amidotransferase A subunit family amidase
MAMKDDWRSLLVDATVDQFQHAFIARELTSRALVDLYLERIDAYDRAGPLINSVIAVSPSAADEAHQLDLALERSGRLTGPLHGIPVVIKDQVDVAGMPTTLGSVLFKDYVPDREATVATRLREAGAIILAKVTLGEFGGGDTHGSLFGSTRNPYDQERTVGGSSGGSAAAVSANLAALAVGQEGFASISRPAAWNGVAGMRPTAGVVSRAGVFDGWPGHRGSVGPLARTVRDLAVLLDVMAGYDPEDPLTALAYGQTSPGYARGLEIATLRNARIGVIRDVVGYNSDPGSEDFERVDAVFNVAIAELERQGATLLDPITIPGLSDLLETPISDPVEAAFSEWSRRSSNPPFRSLQEVYAAPAYATSVRAQRLAARKASQGSGSPGDGRNPATLREEVLLNLLNLAASHRLHAIVHKAVEHEPTLIAAGIRPPYVSHKGAVFINTRLIYVSALTVPAGFTATGLPTGLTFLSWPYREAPLLRLGHAFERATAHRRPPPSTPPLSEPG